MTGAFMVTEADGSQAIWPNVRNASSFCTAMAKTGRQVRAATADEVATSGIDDRITAAAGPVAIQPAGSAEADDPIATAFDSLQIDLAAMMRARCGLDAPEPATATTHPHTIAELLTGAAMAREPQRHRSAAAPALPS